MKKRSAGSATRPLLVASLIFAACCLTIWGLYDRSPALFNQFDDSYITYRYAIQLARGNGLVFNPGEHADSASTLLYTLVLAGVYRAGLHDLEAVGTFFGIASAAGCAVCVYATLRRLDIRGPFAAIFGVGAAMHGFISGWALSGMETTLFAFLVALFIYLRVGRGIVGTAPALVLSLAILVRIEAVLLVGASIAASAWHIRSEEQSVRRRWLFELSVVAFVVASFFAFRMIYYGTLTSGALRLKLAWAEYRPHPVMLLKLWATTTAAALVLACGGLASLRGQQRALIGSYLVLSATWLTFSPSSEWGRYSAHLLPLIMVLAGVGTAAYWRTARPIVIGLLALFAIQLGQSTLAVRDWMERFADHQRCRKQLGAWLIARPPPGAVLSSDIGALAYTAIDVRFVDTMGLTSPGIQQAYAGRGTLDEVLAREDPRWVADTWTVAEDGGLRSQAIVLLERPSRFSGAAISPPEWLGRRQESNTYLCRCDVPDGHSFRVARIVERAEGSPPTN